MFIRHYAVRSQLYSIGKNEYQYTFSSGRALRFIPTPFCHSPGSFVTFDPVSKILFTSDLFGSVAKEWELYLSLEDHCLECVNVYVCPHDNESCPIRDIESFHKSIMPSEKALRYSLNNLLDVQFELIAPQHGSILTEENLINFVAKRLASLSGVGIDGIVEDGYQYSNLKRRFSDI